MAEDVAEFLLQERFLLSAFEFLHELIESGKADSNAARRLSQFFSDPEIFPADQLQHAQTIQDVDYVKIHEEKGAAVERVAVLEYELRLAQEDMKALRSKAPVEVPGPVSPGKVPASSQLEASERMNLNCAVKEYLVSAGYRLTAMTFCEEVTGQDLDDWGQHERVPNALQEYCRAYWSNEKNHQPEILQEPPVVHDSDLLQTMKDSYEKEKASLEKSLEAAQANATQKEAMVQELEQMLKQATAGLDAMKAELQALKEQQASFQRCEPEGGDLEAERVINTVETDDDRQQVPETSTQNTIEEPADTSTSQELHHPREEEQETVYILADALPKIVPFVLINHREELLPLLICAIGRHPDANTRDSLTHALFNLIKRPDEGQRRIIMDACISLSKSIGELRTETELLPQCWEQINHNYEERRLLVAQSCGELAMFVRTDMRSSLILSILEQLIDDPAAVVREGASFHLASLLPLFPNMDKYNKVEKMMFHLLSDSSGQVIDVTLEELVPAVIKWGESSKHSLKQLLQALCNRMLNIIQRCPPLSGVETSSESQLRALGEKERWNVEVLLRMLTQSIPDLLRACIQSCPFEVDTKNADESLVFSAENINQYSLGTTRWEYFDWLIMDLLPCFIKLLLMLPSKEESLRKHTCQLLQRFYECFGKNFHTKLVQPIFLTALGDDSQVSCFGSTISSRIKALKPQTPSDETLAFKCILPVLLPGVLGVHDGAETTLPTFLKNLILDSSLKHGVWSSVNTPELVDSIRFLCSFSSHHDVITNVLWELLMNTNAIVKVHAALLFKELVPYATTQLVAQRVLPALVTLGSDTNLDVKHTTIPAFGIIAQHFRDETVIEKIRVQMDAFLDDGSNEAIVGVIRALTVAVPLASPVFRDYLLQKLVLLTANSMGTNMAKRREKVDVFCEAVRCLDGTDLSPASIRELLVPTIQNLMREPELLDPAHKEALEIILKERSGGKFEAITKVVGASMTSFWGEASTLSPKILSSEQPSSPAASGSHLQQQPQQQQQQQQDEGVLKRMMRNRLW